MCDSAHPQACGCDFNIIIVFVLFMYIINKKKHIIMYFFHCYFVEVCH